MPNKPPTSACIPASRSTEDARSSGVAQSSPSRTQRPRSRQALEEGQLSAVATQRPSLSKQAPELPQISACWQSASPRATQAWPC